MRMATLRTRRSSYVLVALLVLALAVLSVAPSVRSQSRVIVSTDEWSSYLFSDVHGGYNPNETVITSATAPSLAALWTYPGSANQPATSQATTNNGLIYWTSRDGYLHATDQSGNSAWNILVGSTTVPSCSLTTIGQTAAPSVATETINGTPTAVVYAAAGTMLGAYNATTGAQLWKKQLLTTTGSFLWSSPVIFNGNVYIGVGSRKCPDAAGEVAQLDAATGAILHTFSTVPAGCTGATVDDTPVIDESLGRLYVLTGRANSCSAGPEPYANSIIALNAADLSFVDSWQATQAGVPNDFHAAPTLFNATINGTAYQMIGAEQISGTFYAWDRTNLSGGPLWQASIGQSGSSYFYQTAAAWDGTNLYVGSGPTSINATNCAGSLRALDPASGNFLWQTCLQSGAAAGAVSVVPGVAFAGAGNSLVALSTTTGAVLDTYTDTNSGAGYDTAPSVANGMVVGGSLDGSLVALAPAGQMPTPTVTPTATATPSTTSTVGTGSVDDWPSYMYSYLRSGDNTAETAINPGTVGGLHLHWTYTPSSPTPIFSQPVTGNGMIYFGAFDGYERAVDPATGNLIWSQNLGQTNNQGCNPNPVGVVSTATVTTALVQGTPTPVLVVGGGDAAVYELNALTGAILWRTSLKANNNTFIWSSPAVYNGAVYIGRSAQECPERQGEVDMLDLNSGTLLHTFDTVPSGCSGGGVWGSPVIDPTLNRVFVVTGNNAAGCPVAEPYADGVVALNANDLSFVDAWQVPLALQGQDSDFGTTPVLFTATINGVVHQMIGAVKKSGFYYAWDRTNLSAGPLWATNIGVHTGSPYSRTGDVAQVGQGNDVSQTQNTMGNTLTSDVTTQSQQGEQDQQMFSPTGGYSYLSPAAWDGTYLYVAGGAAKINGVGCKGSIQALDPATGHFIWQTCLQSGPVLGAVSLIPGIAFVDEGAKIVAVNTSNGALLYTYLDSASGSFFWGSSSVANGLVVQGNQDGTLTVLGL